MNENIYIKGWYGDWYPVSREKALKFAKNIFCRITNSTSTEHRVAMTNRHIKGVCFTGGELRCH